MVLFVDVKEKDSHTKQTVLKPTKDEHVEMAEVKVHSPDVRYSADYIESDYTYHGAEVQQTGDIYNVTPKVIRMTIRTDRKLPKLGLMMVGWGGNNGSTLTATILANKFGISWNTKEGVQHPNYLGSLTQSSTVSLGLSKTGEEVFVPMRDLLPMVNPNDITVGGWDISSLDLVASMRRAQVLDWDLQQQLCPLMKDMKPKAGIFDPDFIAANQGDRADNIIKGSKWEQMERIRSDIRDFKKSSGVDEVIIVWTANTERFSEIQKGLNDNADNLLASIKAGHSEIAPSTLYVVAAILEGCSYLNGSPQNTFVPGCQELAEFRGVFIGGDDFKSGQTKLKSVLVDFLVGAGIKPRSIVSYNHLGNNDGKNLSAPAQFRSKEISKSNVVDDMVASNRIMYKKGEKPDHCVVIKYVPYVGDSKRALDEYTSEIMMGGRSTIVVHNTCEDSLLASPIILDLTLLTELFQRIRFRPEGQQTFQAFHPVLSILSYLLKAPLVPSGTPVVNALFKQRACIENVMRACIGLHPVHHMGLEHKVTDFTKFVNSVKVKVPEIIPLKETKKSEYSNGFPIEEANRVL